MGNDEYVRKNHPCGLTMMLMKHAKVVGSLLCFSSRGKSGADRNVVRVLDVLAERLGNTRAVCSKYYVHPVLLSAYHLGHTAPHSTVPEKCNTLHQMSHAAVQPNRENMSRFGLFFAMILNLSVNIRLNGQNVFNIVNMTNIKDYMKFY